MRPLILLVLLTPWAQAEECDIVLSNNLSEICYSYKHKSAIRSDYVIYAATVDDQNIKKRPGFRLDKRVHREYATSTRNYTNSGFDRGHIMPDTSTDYNLLVLKESYLMSNIVPQTRKTNRKKIYAIEKLERKRAREAGVLLVRNYMYFDYNPEV